MKKVIFGSALMICGLLAFCTEYLVQAVYFASPNSISYGGGINLLTHGGLALFVIGLLLCLYSFYAEGDSSSRSESSEQEDPDPDDQQEDG